MAIRSNKEKSIEIDDEFLPKTKKNKKKKKFAQNTNRNVVPNIMHQVISFLFKKNRSGALAEKLLNEKGCEGYSMKRFYTYQLLIKSQINHYVNGDCLRVLN